MQPSSETSASAGDRQWSSGRSDAEPVLCACESDLSPVLSVRCAGSPSAPQLRLDNMDEHGVEVAWEMPDEIDDDDLSVCCHQTFKRLSIFLMTTLVAGVVTVNGTSPYVKTIIINEITLTAWWFTLACSVSL